VGKLYEGEGDEKILLLNDKRELTFSNQPTSDEKVREGEFEIERITQREGRGIDPRRHNSSTEPSSFLPFLQKREGRVSF